MTRVYAIIVSISVAIISLDQWTKSIAVEYFSREGESLRLLSWFDFTLVYNRGVAFGMFRDLPENMRVVFLVMLPLLVLVLLWWAYVRHFKSGDLLGPVSMGLVFGGAVGNLIDRIRLGKVVDFVDWHYVRASDQCLGIHLGPLDFQIFFPGRGMSCHWPAFNVADAAISCAFVFLLIHASKQEKMVRLKEKSSK